MLHTHLQLSGMADRGSRRTGCCESILVRRSPSRVSLLAHTGPPRCCVPDCSMETSIMASRNFPMAISLRLQMLLQWLPIVNEKWKNHRSILPPRKEHLISKKFLGKEYEELSFCDKRRSWISCITYLLIFQICQGVGIMISHSPGILASAYFEHQSARLTGKM